MPELLGNNTTISHEISWFCNGMEEHQGHVPLAPGMP